jgi:hypothetical protein
MILGRIFFILGMVGFWELSRYLSSRVSRLLPSFLLLGGLSISLPSPL